MKNLIPVLLLSVLLTSCGGNLVDVAIDNPTEEAIVVTIDSLVVEVPGHEVVWVEMGRGEHKVILENDSTVIFNFTGDAYMLNPSLTSYLKYEEVYGADMAASIANILPSKTVNYLGLELEGNFDVVNELITPVTWDYGPREELPEMVEVDSDENYASLVKLMDPMEFINKMTSAAAEEGIEATEEMPMTDEEVAE